MRGISIMAILAAATLLTACGGGNASIRADAARVNAMGKSLTIMTTNISDEDDISCTISHESSGWITSMWTTEETFTTTCEADPYTDEGPNAS